MRAPRTLAVRTSSDPKQLASAIRGDVRALAPEVPIQEILTLEDQFNASITTERLMASLSSIFGAAAALLATVGLYGVMAQSVNRRAKEIGIRMALGATRRSVLAMILVESGAVAVGGVAAGMAGAAVLTRFAANVLYEVKPLDPLTFAAASIGLLMACLAPAWWSARRAASLDP